MHLGKLGIGAAALLVVGCFAGCGVNKPGQTCHTDAECDSLDQCVDNLCVTRTTGASTAGGSTSGATTGTSGTTGTTGSGSTTGATTTGSTGGAGCLIAGTHYNDGDVNAANACQVCQSASPSDWTTLADGAGCGQGMVCSGGSCQAGCVIAGTFRAPGDVDPNDSCMACNPDSSVSSYSPVTDGTSCGPSLVCQNGQCGTGCDIDGGVVPSGTADPANACESCQPGSSTTSWTTLSDGSDCASSDVCESGVCSNACFIQGALYDADAGNPADTCQGCAPDQSTHAWSERPDGWTCGQSQICHGGACTSGCLVDGGFFTANATAPGDVCVGCYPAASTSDFTASPSGLDCDAGAICNLGVCQSGCFIGDAGYQAPNAIDAQNPCVSCQPAVSTHGWTPTGDNASPSCSSGTVCHSGACSAGCVISGSYYAPDAGEASNTCQVCNPGASTTSWSAGHEGASCASGEVCHTGACTSGCFINGAYVSANALNPSNACESCQPALSTTAYKPLGDGTTCGTDSYCRADKCIYGCNIPGYGVLDAGAPEGTNTCEACQPSTNAFGPVTNGTRCSNGGTVCYNGACDPGCYIGGTYQANGADNAGNTCQTCVDTNPSSWTNANEGATCSVSGGDYCHNSGSGSTCQYGCFISGVFYANGAQNPSNKCQVCSVTGSGGKTAWSPNSEGFACGTGQVCHNATCSTGCYISGTYYTNGTLNPSNSCQSCQSNKSTTGWTSLASGTSCNNGYGLCNSTASCIACPLCGGPCCSPNQCSGTPLRCQ